MVYKYGDWIRIKTLESHLQIPDTELSFDQIRYNETPRFSYALISNLKLLGQVGKIVGIYHGNEETFFTIHFPVNGKHYEIREMSVEENMGYNYES